MSNKNTDLTIYNETIHPGEDLTVALPLPGLFSCAPIYMPMRVIHGKQAGPTLVITAALHGNELNGTKILNQLINLKALKKLYGTLIAIPVVNVYGLINRSRFLPGGINLEKCFPGSSTGTKTSRLANMLVTEIFDKADYLIDLQTGQLNFSHLPQVHISQGDNTAKELAESFNAPVISIDTPSKTSLRQYAAQQGIPFMHYETGEAMRFDEQGIKIGVRGLLRVMRQIGMLKTMHKNKKPTEKTHFYTTKNIWIRADSSGMCECKLKLGQQVKQGQPLCVIRDPFGGLQEATVLAPRDAVIVGINNLPLVTEGEALFQLALFPEMTEAAEHLEDWEEQSPVSIREDQ
jgi:predicted deacylase